MTTSLYDKYGGFTAINGIVSNFYSKITQQESLAHYFAGTDMANLLDHQTKFICKILGGPDNYEGLSLKASHNSLNITEKDFRLVGSLLKDSLIEGGVEEVDVDTIIGIVVGVMDDIVTSAA